MDINEAIMWAEHAQTSMQVNGDPYGAKMLGEAVKALRARLAEVEAQRDKLAGIVRMLIGCIEDLKRYENPDDFEEEIDAARHVLAKLEVSDGEKI